MKHLNQFKVRVILAFSFSLMIILTMQSCKKVDDTYVDYQPTAGNFDGNALQYLESQPEVYDSLLFALNRVPRLADTLATDSVTLFAVSNRSFDLALENINQARHDSIPQMPRISLATIDSAVLDTFLCRYILKERVISKDIEEFADGLFFETIGYQNERGNDTAYNMQMQYVRTNASGYKGGGPKAITFSDPKGSIFYRFWVRVNTITVDIKTKNAIVHLLPPGHDFGFGEEFIRAVNKR